jgi:hypothetical protein
LGNPIDGVDYGYEIHILYNIIAKPESYAHPTLGDSGAEAVEFSWSLTGTPPRILKFRPTVHISIDSTKTPPDVLKLIEDIIWGTATTDPMLPPITEIADIFGYLGALIIIDHGDGSWSAIDESETYITMISDTEFRIDDANATYLDEFTYTVSSTNAGEALVRR